SIPRHDLPRSGRLDDLSTCVLPAVGAGNVTRLELLARAVRARHEVHRRRLPLRAAGPRVRARHLPLRDGHGYFSSSLTLGPLGNTPRDCALIAPHFTCCLLARTRCCLTRKTVRQGPPTGDLSSHGRDPARDRPT